MELIARAIKMHQAGNMINAIKQKMLRILIDS